MRSRTRSSAQAESAFLEREDQQVGKQSWMLLGAAAWQRWRESMTFVCLSLLSEVEDGGGWKEKM